MKRNVNLESGISPSKSSNSKKELHYHCSKAKESRSLKRAISNYLNRWLPRSARLTYWNTDPTVDLDSPVYVYISWQDGPTPAACTHIQYIYPKGEKRGNLSRHKLILSRKAWNIMNQEKGHHVNKDQVVQKYPQNRGSCTNVEGEGTIYSNSIWHFCMLHLPS